MRRNAAEERLFAAGQKTEDDTDMAKKRDAAALTKNEIREAEVTGYTAEGAGVVRVDGVPVFVPGAAQGDRLRVRIVKSLK